MTTHPFQRDKGKVSIVVTNYNHRRFVKAALDSLRKQTYKNIEIIIVDDASTDGSRDVIRAWARQHSRPGHALHGRVVVLELPRNVGFAGAVTAGEYLARGEWIAMHDSDDISHPRRMEKQVQYLRAHPNVGLLGTNYKWFHKHRKDAQRVHWIRYGSDIRATYRKGGHCVCHGTVMFRGELFDRFGGATRSLRGAEDYEFIARCIEQGIQVENLHEVLYYYRQHGAQRSRNFYGSGAAGGGT